MIYDRLYYVIHWWMCVFIKSGVSSQIISEHKTYKAHKSIICRRF